MTDIEARKMIEGYAERRKAAIRKREDFLSSPAIAEYGIDFGHFDGRPIRWLVYADDTNEAGCHVMLVSRECLCELPFHDEGQWMNITWSECSLRKWLNGEFYENAFSDGEKEHIVTANSIPSENRRKNALCRRSRDVICHGTDETPVRDRVTLMKAELLESSGAEHIAGCLNDGLTWWLRDSGIDNSSAACVWGNRLIPEGKPTFESLWVRPMIMIRL